MLDRVGVLPGWRAVDMGCGPLGIMDLLHDRVGPTGSVTGVDVQESMAEAVRGWAEENGLANVDAVTASADDCGLPDDCVDFAHARLLLVNVPDPAGIVREMVRITRPGGWIALHEMDWTSWTCVPTAPVWDRLRTLLAREWSGDVHQGQKLPALLRSAGVVDVGFAPTVPAVMSGDPDHGLMLYFANRARSRLLDKGLVTEVELDDIVGELGEHLANPHSVVVREMVCQAWGRVPLV
ncbi:methyltransferase domain-containing protein [Umezawaea sp. Da 62-37]|uniref:methyltransferase domain-containing protein n=1 Tax=Umezawaea sp. Da 62-37 TaxID=3075927 RepID=UPI0028F71759|nr:methyltransferase domain-containing protein [Umezawaea sp. Da 62-37]WNV86082.1 methyltransferase domain-containing protein [Umezawaea sp. Da 62-37]